MAPHDNDGVIMHDNLGALHIWVKSQGGGFYSTVKIEGSRPEVFTVELKPIPAAFNLFICSGKQKNMV